MEKQRYREDFNALSAPEGMACRVLARAERRRRIKLRAALSLCAALALIGAVALATDLGGDWLEKLIAVNGRDPAPLLQAVGQTAEADGLRLTLQSMADDGMTAWLLMDVESMNGCDLSPAEGVAISESLYASVACDADGDGYSFSCVRLDEGQDPARAQLALLFGFTQPHSGEELRLTIEALGKSVDMQEGGVTLRTVDPLAQGPWTISLRFGKEPPIARFTAGGTAVAISPISVTVEGIHPPLQGGGCLRLKDGSEVGLLRIGFASTDAEGMLLQTSQSAELSVLIDPTQADALILNGQVYSLAPAD